MAGGSDRVFVDGLKADGTGDRRITGVVDVTQSCRHWGVFWMAILFDVALYVCLVVCWFWWVVILTVGRAMSEIKKVSSR